MPTAIESMHLPDGKGRLLHPTVAKLGAHAAGTALREDREKFGQLQQPIEGPQVSHELGPGARPAHFDDEAAGG